MIPTQIKSQFFAHFDRHPQWLVKAPGRVNLIGEHTDYNQGLVMPCAIDFHTWVAAGPRDDHKICVIAADYRNQQDIFSLDEGITFHPQQMWANYIRGVADELLKCGIELRGCNLIVSGNVPQGAA